jgi:hypothetical protein
MRFSDRNRRQNTSFPFEDFLPFAAEQSVVHSPREGLCPDFLRRSATLFGQNDRTLNRRMLRKDLQFSFSDGEFREAALQTDHQLRENPNDVFVQTFESGEMDSNFAVEPALTVGLALLTHHDSPTAWIWNCLS